VSNARTHALKNIEVICYPAASGSCRDNLFPHSERMKIAEEDEEGRFAFLAPDFSFCGLSGVRIFKP